MSAVAENEKAKHLEEPIFDLNAPPDEPLDEKIVQFSIYNDINPEKKKTKQDKEWSLRVTCAVEWFIRCSWINKFLFLDILCQVTAGCNVLESVLKSIESIFSKDVLESMCYDSTNFCYDRIPTDDNRALELQELDSAMRDTYFWFLNLDPGYQAVVILKLLRLGGGGLVFSIYKSAQKYYRERQAIGKLLSVLPSGSLSGMKGSRQKIKDDAKSKVSTQNTEAKSLESENRELSEFAHKKQQQLERRNAELVNYKKLKGILEEENKKTKKGGETKETVDYLQILPIWLNRKIMSYIDDKTLAGFKKVGKYWGKMIDESINEKSGRKAINVKINKIIAIKPEKEGKKSEVTGEDEEFEFIVELGPKDLINKMNENEAALIATSELYGVIFSRRSTILNLDSSYYPDRCGAFDNSVGIIACSTPNNTIQFYSSRTGSRFNFFVFGLESSVTCLALHKNKTNIFIGCKDGSLISKDIRTNKTTSVFNGHSNAILSIFTTSSNLLSASLDNTVKYFRLWSGLCLLCIDLNPDLNISSLLLRMDKPSWAAMGTSEGFLVLADVETRKFLTKAKLYTDAITQLAHEGDFLITGSRSGKIRIWNMNQLMQEQNREEYMVILKPYYSIDLGSSVVCLKFYKNQIFSGCENGTVKIISLVTGRVLKTLRISSETPITGVDTTEDKLFMKLIIWHEKGIEIRTFSLQKSSFRKIPKEKDNQESKQKAPMETKKNKASEMVLRGYVRPSHGLIEATSNAYKRTTFAGLKKPLRERCCTLPSLRTEHQKLLEFKSGVFTEAYNSRTSKSYEFLLHTFPRLKNLTKP